MRITIPFFVCFFFISCQSSPNSSSNSDSTSLHNDSALSVTDSVSDKQSDTTTTSVPDSFALLSVTNWTIDDFITDKKYRSYEALRNTTAYNKEEWKDVKSPIVATYKGCDVGDYFHLNFEDVNGKTYDFGFGDNNLGEFVLCNEPQFETNHKYLNRTFRIYWNWKITKFPCCDGDYEIVEAYIPSITKLELIVK
ncbi:MAG: hypothetical protein IPI10_19255 [Bacteroidetes bacterium]|nr:hypothetical protein [Bacteroidota bacterium]